MSCGWPPALFGARHFFVLNLGRPKRSARMMRISVPLEAFASFERALMARRKLIKESPDTPANHTVLALTLQCGGILAKEFGRAGEAVANHHEAITLLEGLAKRKPGYLYSLPRRQWLRTSN
jgi:hypothetical protein